MLPLYNSIKPAQNGAPICALRANQRSVCWGVNKRLADRATGTAGSVRYPTTLRGRREQMKSAKYVLPAGVRLYVGGEDGFCQPLIA
jgi:hypothetical protein